MKLRSLILLGLLGSLNCKRSTFDPVPGETVTASSLQECGRRPTQPPPLPNDPTLSCAMSSRALHTLYVRGMKRNAHSPGAWPRTVVFEARPLSDSQAYEARNSSRLSTQLRPETDEAQWLACEYAHGRNPALEFSLCLMEEPIAVTAVVQVHTPEQEDRSIVIDGREPAYTTMIEIRRDNRAVPFLAVSFPVTTASR